LLTSDVASTLTASSTALAGAERNPGHEGSAFAVEAIEKLGDSKAGPGYLLLGLLSQRGWFVGVTGAFAGGILVIADHPVWGRVERQGESVASIATDLVNECLTRSASGPLH
jgi:hypothetical protein